MTESQPFDPKAACWLVDQFQRQELGVSRFLHNIEAIVKSIPASECELQQILEDIWSEMEIVYSLAVSDGDGNLDESELQELVELSDSFKRKVTETS